MNTVDLNYKVIGNGKPLIILHGLFGSLDNWQTIASDLSEQGLKVFTVDLRNHGRSPHTNEMNHDLMTQDVKKFIEDHNILDATLLGHSMGGKTAMNLSLKHPDLISELIVVDIAPKPYIAHHHKYFEAMLELDVANMQSRREATEKLGEKIKSQAVLLFIAKNLKRCKEGGFEWKFNLNALYENYASLIDGLHVDFTFDKPTLFIGGKKSDYITPGDHQQIRKNFPNARIEMIENAGHWVHAEQPEKFKQLILEFINE